MQGGLADGDGLGVGGEQADEGRGSGHTDDGACRHDDGAHAEGELVELCHAGVLLCTVVVADEGAHSLHDAVGGQIEERLEFIVDAQHHHIAFGEGRQQAVEEGDQHGGQGQIQDGRHTDGVETAFEREVRPQGLPAQMDGRLGGAVDHEVDDESGGLSDAGSQRRACNAHGRHRAEAEDEDGVQQDVADTARDEGDHGELHPAHGLEELLKGEAGHVHGSEQEDDGGVGHAHGDDGAVGGEPGQEAGHDSGSRQRAEDAVEHREGHAVGGGGVRPVVVACAPVEGDEGVDAYAEADGNGVHEVLDGEHKGEGRHGLLVDLGHEEAVHDVVQRVHQHGDDVGQSHRHQQREHRLRLHKSIVHGGKSFLS